MLPDPDNHVYGQKGKIRFMYKKAKDWKEAMQIWCLNENKKRKISDKPLKATIAFFVKRDRDAHGSGKLIMDTFQGIVYENDKQFIDVRFLKFIDKVNPRVNITIEEI